MNQAKAMPQTALLAYPKQAAFGRVLPKTKIYEHSKISTRLKDLFVAQVEKIVWQYKLAPETINLPAMPGVPEIQVLGITLKTPELHQEVLRSIDDAIPFPLIFELHRGQGDATQTQVVAAYKRPSENDASRWLRSDYLACDWVPSDTQRLAIPLALNLGGLYAHILHRLNPAPVRAQETLANWVTRVEEIAAKEREIEKTAKKLAKEKQFNRKVDINARLRQLINERKELTR